MTMSKEEAEGALAEIERITGRGHTLRGYRFAGPILVLWGVIWVVGYVAMGFLPVRGWGLVWAVLDLVGLALTTAMAPRGRGGRAGAWRPILAFLPVAAFFGAVFTMFRAVSLDTYLAFPGVVAGMLYFALGLWRFTRFVWIGVAMFVASLVGFYLVPTGLTFWMAATGGGGLIVGGLWLRRA